MATQESIDALRHEMNINYIIYNQVSSEKKNYYNDKLSGKESGDIEEINQRLSNAKMKYEVAKEQYETESKSFKSGVTF
jgi:hypothetical protein